MKKGNAYAFTGAFVRRLAGLLSVFVALAIAQTAVAVGTKGTVSTPETAFQMIASSGPLDQIYLGNDIAAQIAHTGDESFEVYPPDTTPGDYGTLIVVGPTLYAPDFTGHGETASESIGPNTTFTPVSQSAIAGTGTSANPFTVITIVGVGDTGLTITQTDSYVVGQESYRTDVTVANASSTPVSAVLYRAMDCFLGDSDSGYGIVNGTSVGCSINANNTPPGLIEQLVPLTGGNDYYEAGYNDVWTAIGTHAPFNNTCLCDEQIDNGSGISWNITVPGNGSITRSNLTVFSSTGSQAIVVTKTADSASAAAGGSDGYTITVTNPNAIPATLNSITDSLPAGFSYTAGSSSGATTADPTIAGQVLTWTGSFIAPAGGSVSLHFNVTVPSVPGTYLNQATADAGSLTVAGTGLTAAVAIGGGGGGGPPPSTIPLPTLSSGMLAALVLILLFAGILVGRRARN